MFVVAGGTGAGQIVVLAATPAITRLYSPADFGVLAVYASIVSVVGVAAALRYEIAIPIPSEDNVAANLAALAMFAVLSVSVLVLIAVGMAGDQISNALKVPQLSQFRWLIPVGIAGAGSYQVLTYWAIRRRAMARVARTRFTQSCAQVFVQLGLAGVLPGPGGLLVGDVAGRAGGTTSLLLGALKDDNRLLRGVTPKAMLQAASRYRRFPMISSGSVVLNSLALYLPALALAAFYGPAVAGWFALSQRVIAAPMSLLGRSVAVAYNAQAAAYIRGDRHLLEGFARKVSGQLLLLGLVPIITIAVVSPWAFRLAFGPEWATAGQYTQILAIAYLVHFVAVPISQTLNLLERQDTQLYWDVGRLGLVGVALLWPASQGWDARIAIASYALALVIAYGVLIALVYRASSCRQDKNV